MEIEVKTILKNGIPSVKILSFLNTNNVTQNGFNFTSDVDFISDEKDKSLRIGELNRYVLYIVAFYSRVLVMILLIMLMAVHKRISVIMLL